MRQRNRRVLSAAVAAFGLGLAGAAAPAQEPTTTELRAQIAALQAKVDQLEANQQNGQLAASAQTKQDVADDASRRSSSLAESEFTAGWQKGKFLVQSDDGRFVLHPWFQFQPRHVVNYREGADGADDDTESGFEIRRMKFGVDGNVYGKNNTYLFNWGTNRNGGALVLEEAWIRHAFADVWAIRGGQIKEPYSHENIASSKQFLAADRSLLNEFFVGGDNYLQGVSLAYGADTKPFQAEVAYHDGAQSANTNFQDDVATPDTRPDFGASARAQYKLFGEWKQYSDFTAMGNGENLLVVGGGLNFNQVGDVNVFGQTVDAQYETDNGLGFYVGAHGRANDGGNAAGADSLFDWGAMAQVGYMLTPRHWEVFGRYSYTDFDDDTFAAGVEDTVHEITGGVNYYFDAHNAKMTIDATYLPNGCPVNVDGAGVLANDGEAEIVVRTQFQLLL